MTPDKNRLKNSMYNNQIDTANSVNKHIKESQVIKQNSKSRLLGHVNFDGQNHRFVRKGNKNGFISGFGHYFPDFG